MTSPYWYIFCARCREKTFNTEIKSLLRWIFLRHVRKALNLSDVFIAKAELELNGDATCQREPLVGNPITGNPIGLVVGAQQLVATLSLHLCLFLLTPPTVVLPHQSLWRQACECQGYKAARPLANFLPGGQRGTQDINAAPCQLQFTVTTVSLILRGPSLSF